jgi:hypothetical protein
MGLFRKRGRGWGWGLFQMIFGELWWVKGIYTRLGILW